MNQTTLNQITAILGLVSTLEPTALALVQALMSKVSGLTISQIEALADTQYIQLAAASQTELNKLAAAGVISGKG